MASFRSTDSHVTAAGCRCRGSSSSIQSSPGRRRSRSDLDRVLPPREQPHLLHCLDVAWRKTNPAARNRRRRARAPCASTRATPRVVAAPPLRVALGQTGAASRRIRRSRSPGRLGTVPIDVTSFGHSVHRRPSTRALRTVAASFAAAVLPDPLPERALPIRQDPSGSGRDGATTIRIRRRWATGDGLKEDGSGDGCSQHPRSGRRQRRQAAPGSVATVRLLRLSSSAPAPTGPPHHRPSLPRRIRPFGPPLLRRYLGASSARVHWCCCWRLNRLLLLVMLVSAPS